MSFAEQLARLQVFLDADDLHEEALDYIAAHGYLTALCICSEQVPEREWIDALFSEPPKYKDDTEREAIEATLVSSRPISRASWPATRIWNCRANWTSANPDESDLRGWCIGFMEGVFMREAVWFEDSEEEVSELLLPIMVGSGLFDEQPEFTDIADNPDLVDEMVAQIPELLTALYLICHAPEEKPALLKPRRH